MKSFIRHYPFFVVFFTLMGMIQFIILWNNFYVIALLSVLILLGKFLSGKYILKNMKIMEENSSLCCKNDEILIYRITCIPCNFYFLMAISILILILSWQLRSTVSVLLGCYIDYIRTVFLEARQNLSVQFDLYYAPEKAELLKAIILGQRGGNPEIEELLRQAGAGHLLALSGLHIGYVIFFCRVFLGWISKIFRLEAVKFLNLIFIPGYVLLAGASPSLLRAGIMGAAWIMLSYSRFSGSTLNILGVAGTFILLINPNYLEEISFQLSFLVLGSLIIFLPVFKSFLPLPLAVSAAAQPGAQPLLLYMSGILNLNGFVANLILIPLLGPIILTNLLFLLIAPVSKSAASLMASAGNFLLDPFLSLASICSELPLYINFTDGQYFTFSEKFYGPETLIMPAILMAAYAAIFLLPEAISSAFYMWKTDCNVFYLLPGLVWLIASAYLLLALIV